MAGLPQKLRTLRNSWTRRVAWHLGKDCAHKDVLAVTLSLTTLYLQSQEDGAAVVAVSDDLFLNKTSWKRLVP